LTLADCMKRFTFQWTYYSENTVHDCYPPMSSRWRSLCAEVSAGHRLGGGLSSETIVKSYTTMSHKGADQNRTMPGSPRKSIHLTLFKC